VPLATAEEFGGFTQGLYPANRHKFTERGPIADYPPEQCCFKSVNWATDERGELNRELEAIQWMDSENLAAAPVIVLEGPTLVAHGGGWGDYQGGGGDNYFHVLQTLASVSFLLPQLKSDPSARLLIRICKDPWAKLKKKFFDKTYKHKVEVSEGKEVKSFFECGVEQYALELLEILGIPLQQVYSPRVLIMFSWPVCLFPLILILRIAHMGSSLLCSLSTAHSSFNSFIFKCHSCLFSICVKQITIGGALPLRRARPHLQQLVLPLRQQELPKVWPRGEGHKSLDPASARATRRPTGRTS